MWPFKKKAKEVIDPEKHHKGLKFKIEYKLEKWEIGRTLVRHTFLDGRKFGHWYYGEFSQYVTLGNGDLVEPTAILPSITTSLEIAQRTITFIDSQINMTLVDDPKNIKKAVNGFPIVAEILKTESYFEEFSVAYLVENKED